MANPYDIAAYCFPNCHQDPRSDAAHGKGWTEGSYLEPDTIHGFGYLEVVKAVSGQSLPAHLGVAVKQVDGAELAVVVHHMQGGKAGGSMGSGSERSRHYLAPGLRRSSFNGCIELLSAVFENCKCFVPRRDGSKERRMLFR